MKLLILSSSQRPDSQSARVADFMASTAGPYSGANHIQLRHCKLPFWQADDPDQWSAKHPWHQLHQQTQTADALVLVTPDWHGMASPLLRNFLLMCNNLYTAHKPVLLVGVSGGIGGSYPVAELRMNALQNSQLVAIPTDLIVRDVDNMLYDTPTKANGTTNHKPGGRDHRLRQRIEHSLNTLYQYSVALRPIRQQLSRSQP